MAGPRAEVLRSGVSERRDSTSAALKCAHADAGAGERCRAANRRSPCRRGWRHAPVRATSPWRRELRVPCAILRASRPRARHRRRRCRNRPPSARGLNAREHRHRQLPAQQRPPAWPSGAAGHADTVDREVGSAKRTAPAAGRGSAAWRVLHQPQAHRQRLELAQAAVVSAAALPACPRKRLLEQRVRKWAMIRRAIDRRGSGAVLNGGAHCASAQEQRYTGCRSLRRRGRRASPGIHGTPLRRPGTWMPTRMRP